jgi:hypothetical protein
LIRVAQRGMSLSLIVIAVLFVARTYTYWSDPHFGHPLDFLLRSAWSFAFPLLVTGILLWIRPVANWPPILLPVILVLLGLAGLSTQNYLAPPDLSVPFYDGPELRFKFALALGIITIPLWVLCFTTSLWRMSWFKSRLSGK